MKESVKTMPLHIKLKAIVYLNLVAHQASSVGLVAQKKRELGHSK